MSFWEWLKKVRLSGGGSGGENNVVFVEREVSDANLVTGSLSSCSRNVLGGRNPPNLTSMAEKCAKGENLRIMAANVSARRKAEAERDELAGLLGEARAEKRQGMALFALNENLCRRIDAALSDIGRGAGASAPAARSTSGSAPTAGPTEPAAPGLSHDAEPETAVPPLALEMTQGRAGIEFSTPEPAAQDDGVEALARELSDMAERGDNWVDIARHVLARERRVLAGIADRAARAVYDGVPVIDAVEEALLEEGGA